MKVEIFHIDKEEIRFFPIKQLSPPGSKKRFWYMISVFIKHILCKFGVGTRGERYSIDKKHQFYHRWVGYKRYTCILISIMYHHFILNGCLTVIPHCIVTFYYLFLPYWYITYVLIIPTILTIIEVGVANWRLINMNQNKLWIFFHNKCVVNRYLCTENKM